jgi:hypothetical protein
MQATDKTMDELVKESIIKEVKLLTVEKLTLIANKLHISIYTSIVNKQGKQIKFKKIDLIQCILIKLQDLTISELINMMKETKIGFEIEVKSILKNNISINELINTNICLPLSVFLKEHPIVESLFTNTCDLENINNNIKSNNCIPCEMQGLYIHTINKNGIDYITKLGSFAESQGMFKRICSFGGGNYETGSATNKWFQEFVKKAIAEGYSSKFTYYNKIQEKIKINGLDGEMEMMPYVTRPLESQLFHKYNASNFNIPPIFGSNCL